MRVIFFVAFLGLSLSTYSLKGQSTPQPLPPGVQPRFGVTVLSDGKPTSQQAGIAASTKEIRFRALLDTKSNAFFNDFESEILIKDTEVILARNGQKIGQINLNNTHLSTDFLQQAQPEDHIIFTFTLLAQRKNGDLVTISEKPVYNFPIRQ